MLDTAFILAAGMGTRMRPLTHYTAKPLLHFRGEKLIERHLRRLADAQIKQVLINCSWHNKQLRQQLGDGQRYGLDIVYSCEDNTPLETAGGISRASDLLGDKSFLLINGDIWTDLDLGAFHQNHCSPSIVLTSNPPHNPEGDFSITDDGYLRNTGTEKLTYAGVGILNCQLLPQTTHTTAKLADTLRSLAKQGELKGYEQTGEWFDIGRPTALQI